MNINFNALVHPCSAFLYRCVINLKAILFYYLGQRLLYLLQCFETATCINDTIPLLPSQSTPREIAAASQKNSDYLDFLASPPSPITIQRSTVEVAEAQSVPFEEIAFSAIDEGESIQLDASPAPQYVPPAVLPAFELLLPPVVDNNVLPEGPAGLLRKPIFVAELLEAEHLTVRRDFVYQEMSARYTSDPNIVKHRLYIDFKNEISDDFGGPAKEMFCLFWEQGMLEYFEGVNECVPRLNPDLQADKLLAMGSCLSHGFVLLDYLPISFCLASFCRMLLPPNVEVPDEVLRASFKEFISEADSCFLDKVTAQLASGGTLALSGRDTNRLLGFLDRYGCKAVPKTAPALSKYILDIARCELVQRPLHALQIIGEGMKAAHPGLWDDINIGEINNLYTALRPSNECIADMLITDEEQLPEGDQKVFNFLETWILDAEHQMLAKFLQYVTATKVVLPQSKITVQFNGTYGLATRFSVSTCANTIQLPRTIPTYRQFQDMLTKTLNNRLTWEYNSL